MEIGPGLVAQAYEPSTTECEAGESEEVKDQPMKWASDGIMIQRPFIFIMSLWNYRWADSQLY